MPLDHFSYQKPQQKPTKLQKKPTIVAADLFAGAGGTSNGLIEAVSELGYNVRLTAVNHWEIAVATHTRNHPDARHLCKAIDSVNPLELFPERRVQLLVASPECTHHSNARGGKPRSEQKRADAWDLKRWIEKLYIENLLIENVKEFVDWGPLGANGQPLKSQKGIYFKQFIEFLRVLYRVEWRVLNCADYGDPTSRERFFLLARRPKSQKIFFPEPTHASRKVLAKKQPDLFSPGKELKPWVPARTIIDWSLKGKSVFGRKRPLSENTMRRIFAGLFKFSLKPFLLPNEGFFRGNQPRDLDEPVPTVTSRGGGSVVEPFLLNLKASTRRMRSIDEPTFTQCSANHQMLVEPFIIGAGGASGQQSPRSLDEPLRTITGTQTFALIEPFLVQYFGGATVKSIDEPLPTVTANYEHYGLTEAFITSYHGNHQGKSDGTRRSYSIDDALPTLDTSNRFGIVEPFFVKYHGNETGAHSIDEPLSTLTTKDRLGLVEPFLVRYKNNQDAQSLDEPLGTLTTKDCYGIIEPRICDFDQSKLQLTDQNHFKPDEGEIGLCLPDLCIVIFIRFRMLQPNELAAAMSFPKGYSFAGTRDQQVKQIGNAVPRRTAKALCRSLIQKRKR